MREHILIAEDEEEIADLLEVYLENDGYIVHKFTNGTDALKCKKHLWVCLLMHSPLISYSSVPAGFFSASIL